VTSSQAAPTRGQVFRVDLGHGVKPWVVVSNDARNRNLETVVAARITTRDRHANIPTVVALSPSDPLVGYVLVDDLVQLYRDELSRQLGALTPATMSQISQALRIALP
jgi:mRNA interferase MazF